MAGEAELGFSELPAIQENHAALGMWHKECSTDERGSVTEHSATAEDLLSAAGIEGNGCSCETTNNKDTESKEEEGEGPDSVAGTEKLSDNTNDCIQSTVAREKGIESSPSRGKTLEEIEATSFGIGSNQECLYSVDNVDKEIEHARMGLNESIAVNVSMEKDRAVKEAGVLDKEDNESKTCTATLDKEVEGREAEIETLEQAHHPSDESSNWNELVHEGVAEVGNSGEHDGDARASQELDCQGKSSDCVGTSDINIVDREETGTLDNQKKDIPKRLSATLGSELPLLEVCEEEEEGAVDSEKSMMNHAEKNTEDSLQYEPAPAEVNNNEKRAPALAASSTVSPSPVNLSKCQNDCNSSKVVSDHGCCTVAACRELPTGIAAALGEINSGFETVDDSIAMGNGGMIEEVAVETEDGSRSCSVGLESADLPLQMNQQSGSTKDSLSTKRDWEHPALVLEMPLCSYGHSHNEDMALTTLGNKLLQPDELASEIIVSGGKQESFEDGALLETTCLPLVAKEPLQGNIQSEMCTSLLLGDMQDVSKGAETVPPTKEENKISEDLSEEEKEPAPESNADASSTIQSKGLEGNIASAIETDSSFEDSRIVQDNLQVEKLSLCCSGNKDADNLSASDTVCSENTGQGEEGVLLFGGGVSSQDIVVETLVSSLDKEPLQDRPADTTLIIDTEYHLQATNQAGSSDNGLMEGSLSEALALMDTGTAEDNSLKLNLNQGGDASVYSPEAVSCTVELESTEDAAVDASAILCEIGDTVGVSEMPLELSIEEGDAAEHGVDMASFHPIVEELEYSHGDLSSKTLRSHRLTDSGLGESSCREVSSQLPEEETESEPVLDSPLESLIPVDSSPFSESVVGATAGNAGERVQDAHCSAEVQGEDSEAPPVADRKPLLPSDSPGVCTENTTPCIVNFNSTVEEMKEASFSADGREASLLINGRNNIINKMSDEIVLAVNSELSGKEETVQQRLNEEDGAACLEGIEEADGVKELVGDEVDFIRKVEKPPELAEFEPSINRESWCSVGSCSEHSLLDSNCGPQSTERRREPFCRAPKQIPHVWPEEEHSICDTTASSCSTEDATSLEVNPFYESDSAGLVAKGSKEAWSLPSADVPSGGTVPRMLDNGSAVMCDTEEEEKDRITEVPMRPSVFRTSIRSLSPFRRHSWGPGKNAGNETEINQRSYSLEGLATESAESKEGSSELNLASSGSAGPQAVPLPSSEDRGSLVSLTEEELELDPGKSSVFRSQRCQRPQNRVLSRSISPLSSPLSKSVSMVTINQPGLEYPSISEESCNQLPPSPSRKDSEGKSGTKVSRTFSYLRNKISTSKKNKEKGKDKDSIKEKDRECKEKEKDKKTLNGHVFSAAPVIGPLQCHCCNKPFNSKESYLCAHCNACVHKGCRESLMPCAKFKMKVREVSELGRLFFLYCGTVPLITHQTEEDHADLASALGMVKEVIAAVDSKVNEYEKKARLNEIYNKTDSKSIMRMKTGQMFAKEDLKRRKLVHDGPVLLKNSAGRFKEVQAVLLSDVLVFLQEKDQKYVFPALDQKSTVISLKKLIVREVANQEKGLFLITVGTADAEMVEVYANSKEERNNWMQRIQQTTNRIEKDEDEGIPSESEEDRRVLETKAREMREQLKQRDQQILSLLQEKGKIFREMADCGGQDEGDQSPASRILFRANSEDIPKGEIVMTDALKEVESLQGFVDRALGGTLGQQSPTSSEQEGIVGPVSLPRRAETFGGFDSHQMNTSKNGDKDEGEEGQELRRTESDSVLKKGGNANLATLVKKTNEQVLQSVTRLYNLLSTLQAVVVQQDSFIEDQRLALSERSLTRSSSRPNSLIEQEKQRSLEKQRQELANLQKQQAQHLEEKRKREREWEMRERELTGREARLTQSREQVDRDREQLEREKEELQAKKEEYQHDLERLRAAQKQLEKGQEQVARDRERLAQKQMEASCQMSNQHSKGTRTSCGFLNSEDPKWHSSSSLEKEDSETSVLPKMDAPCRTDCKQKGKNFMPFGLLGSANQANKQSEGQNPAQARFLQLAKPKEKKEKKKKKSKGHRSQPADAHTSEPAAEGEEIFC
nr:PREDICTED: uncharacterized protein LOC102348397 [Latimeria chalumnae]|eukprot:XP_014342695.1 PREDICTED: uncharacterized protein LOC102348397 [Latimeria chalumnae]